MWEILVIIASGILLCIVLMFADWYYGIDCPKCHNRMIRKYNHEKECEEFICCNCGYKEEVYG